MFTPAAAAAVRGHRLSVLESLVSAAARSSVLPLLLVRLPRVYVDALTSLTHKGRPAPADSSGCACSSFRCCLAKASEGAQASAANRFTRPWPVQPDALPGLQLATYGGGTSSRRAVPTPADPTTVLSF